MIKWLFAVFILTVLLLVLQRTINPQQVLDLLVDFPKDILIVLLTISLVISTVKAYRFFNLLKKSNVNISIWAAVRSYLAGGVISSLPGGEFLRVLFLKKEERDIRAREIIAPILTQSYIEVLVAAIIVVIGSIIFEILLVPAFLAFLLAAGILIFLINDKPLRLIVERSIRFRSLNGLLAKLRKSQILVREILIYKKSTYRPELLQIH